VKVCRRTGARNAIEARRDERRDRERREVDRRGNLSVRGDVTIDDRAGDRSGGDGGIRRIDRRIGRLDRIAAAASGNE
jgi:hypothetical protein